MTRISQKKITIHPTSSHLWPQKSLVTRVASSAYRHFAWLPQHTNYTTEGMTGGGGFASKPNVRNGQHVLAALSCNEKTDCRLSTLTSVTFPCACLSYPPRYSATSVSGVHSRGIHQAPASPKNTAICPACRPMVACLEQLHVTRHTSQLLDE